MSDNSAVTGVMNLLLCGATGFGFYQIGPQEHPYAFTACVVGFCHGLLGLVATVSGDENTTKANDATNALMEIVPLPLVNVDLFMGADSNNLALGHGLFIVPLAVSVIIGWAKDNDENGSVIDALKTLTVLGNITSMVYLALNESSWNLGGMAFLAFMAKFGAAFFEENVSEGTGQPITYISWSGFFFLTALAVAGEK
ncbi:uncharacterized protein [Drosophila pseudoobscura]|uniref:uncharacterized protein LOC4815646 n=1 Tax=Drosophila pseudoobscura pseudoobscura TaxID=46245 RepID=A0A6I8W9X0_DROPS|nr:uncharacterized protein LOC4815646 [Drosophila pseudoobscura]XP_033239369.1 uncharacterized protein LOC4815646 [Drosophila pseudoobscura]